MGGWGEKRPRMGEGKCPRQLIQDGAEEDKRGNGLAG